MPHHPVVWPARGAPARVPPARERRLGAAPRVLVQAPGRLRAARHVWRARRGSRAAGIARREAVVRGGRVAQRGGGGGAGEPRLLPRGASGVALPARWDTTAALLGPRPDPVGLQYLLKLTPLLKVKSPCPSPCGNPLNHFTKLFADEAPPAGTPRDGAARGAARLRAGQWPLAAAGRRAQRLLRRRAR
jgi:hypothetical protein